ncbi:hypothetical protein KF840_18875 [bacterium]|nr:hypothetical protein [bacterium]
MVEVLDAIAADAETIRQVYAQMHSAEMDDVGALTAAEKPSGPQLEAEGPGSGIRRAQERLERRKQRQREAADLGRRYPAERVIIRPPAGRPGVRPPVEVEVVTLGMRIEEAVARLLAAAAALDANAGADGGHHDS